MSDWTVTDDDWSAPSGIQPGADAEVQSEADLGAPATSILIVDDDPAIRKMLTFLFEDEGYDVTAANDGSEALVVLEARPPDAMILDLMMPNIDGHGVLRARKERGLATDTRVLVLTAKSDPQDVVWCWELGADEFLNKPIDPERCQREIDLLLKRTPDEMRERRAVGLAEAKRLDVMERAFDGRKRRRQ